MDPVILDGGATAVHIMAPRVPSQRKRSQERIRPRCAAEDCDSPGDGAQVPGLQLVNDVRLQHHGLAGRHLLPQKVSNHGGEL